MWPLTVPHMPASVCGCLHCLWAAIVAVAEQTSLIAYTTHAPLGIDPVNGLVTGGCGSAKGFRRPLFNPVPS